MIFEIVWTQNQVSSGIILHMLQVDNNSSQHKRLDSVSHV